MQLNDCNNLFLLYALLPTKFINLYSRFSTQNNIVGLRRYSPNQPDFLLRLAFRSETLRCRRVPKFLSCGTVKGDPKQLLRCSSGPVSQGGGESPWGCPDHRSQHGLTLTLKYSWDPLVCNHRRKVTLNGVSARHCGMMTNWECIPHQEKPAWSCISTNEPRYLAWLAL